MQCPVCRTPMVILEFDDVEVDYCPSCEGCWLDRGELELLLQETAQEELEISTTGASKRRCPRCNKKMRSGDFPSTAVEIDVCPRDGGIWLDRGELLEIAESNASGEAVERIKNYFAGLFHGKKADHDEEG